MELPVHLMVNGLFIFLRFVGLMVTAPLLGMGVVPWRIRISLALGTTYLLVGALDFPQTLPTSLAVLGLQAVAEIMLGLATGFVASLFVHGVRMAGQLAGMQMGLGFSALIDPFSGDQTTVLARFLGLITLMVIMSFNGHHVLLLGLAHGLHQMPPGQAWHSLARIATGVPLVGASLFVTAVLVSAPALVTVFCLKVGMALLARAAPQMHVLAVGFIVTIVVGVMTIAISLSDLGDFVRVGFEQAARRALDLCAMG